MIFLGLRWRFVRINPRNLLLFIVPEVEEDRRHQAGVYIYLSKRCRWEICFYIVIKHISRVTSFWLYSGQLLSEMVPREMSNKMLGNLI